MIRPFLLPSPQLLLHQRNVGDGPGGGGGGERGEGGDSGCSPAQRKQRRSGRGEDHDRSRGRRGRIETGGSSRRGEERTVAGGRREELIEEEPMAAELRRGEELICTFLFAGQRSLPATYVEEKLVCVCVCPCGAY